MRWRRAASAKLLLKKLREKFHRHFWGTVCTKAPYRSWHIQDRVPMETTNKIWYPVSALSNQSWSICHPSCHSWASLEHLCCWGALNVPEVLAKGITWGLWIPHTFPAWLPVPAQDSALTASCCCSSWLLGQNSAWSEWAEKGESALVHVDTAFACYPLFYRNLNCPWLEKPGHLGSWFSCSNRS